MLDEVGAIGAAVRSRSAAIEAARRLPDDVVALLRETGVMKAFVPKRYGGGELTPAEGVAAVEALAVHDGSAAWCAMIAMTTGVLAGYLPEGHAEALFSDPGAIAGGFAAPVGTAEPVPGGLSVTGRWQWGSGTSHCTAIGGGVRLPDGTSRFAFFDRDDVELLDTWHVAGLRGTGSTDYVVERAFVPDGRSVAVGAEPPVEDGPLYRFSFFGLLAAGVAAVALGLAERAIEELVALALVKSPQGSSRPLADRAPVQAEVAAAEGEQRAARALLDDVLGRAWATVEAGDRPTVEERRSIRLAATHAVHASASAVDRMYTAAGGAAVFTDHPLQRVFRDVHVATQHAITAPRTYELAGRLRLGLATETGQL